MRGRPRIMFTLAPRTPSCGSRGEFFTSRQLSAPEEERSLIDTFFHSLAEDRQAGAIGIVLSGSGTDGTLGLKAISDSGGMTMVQEPATAGHESMPRSGATLGVADRVLPPEKMPDEILAYARHLAIASVW